MECFLHGRSNRCSSKLRNACDLPKSTMHVAVLLSPALGYDQEPSSAVSMALEAISIFSTASLSTLDAPIRSPYVAAASGLR